MRRGAVVVLEGAKPLDVGIPAQVFTTRPSMPYSVRVCGVRAGLVSGADGLSYHVDQGLEALEAVSSTHLDAYKRQGADTMTLEACDHGPRLLLPGVVPFGEEIVMWWNFVGRDHDEIVEFRRRYQAELGFEAEDPRDAGKPPLFGEFPEGQPTPIPAPVLPLTRLRSRR